MGFVPFLNSFLDYAKPVENKPKKLWTHAEEHKNDNMITAAWHANQGDKARNTTGNTSNKGNTSNTSNTHKTNNKANRTRTDKVEFKLPFKTAFSGLESKREKRLSGEKLSDKTMSSLFNIMKTGTDNPYFNKAFAGQTQHARYKFRS